MPTKCDSRLSPWYTIKTNTNTLQGPRGLFSEFYIDNLFEIIHLNEFIMSWIYSLISFFNEVFQCLWYLLWKSCSLWSQGFERQRIYLKKTENRMLGTKRKKSRPIMFEYKMRPFTLDCFVVVFKTLRLQVWVSAIGLQVNFLNL